MEYTLKDNVLTVYLVGRIDSQNAAEAEAQAFAVCRANPAEKVVLDCARLDYVSSAGLRVVLKLRKAYPTLRLVDVQPDVYDIFEMTGFTEMMPIEKAFRTLSVEGCAVIGEGANGKVYRTAADTIVKVYRWPDCLDDIRRERELAKRAFILGIPTAISYEVVKVGDNYGSVFELLDAKSIAEILAAEPTRMDEMVNLYVDLLKKIHATTGDRAIMSDMKRTAEEWAIFDKDYLSPEAGDKLLSLVREIPFSDKMMHGDYHVKNVMIQSGEAILIDMDTVCVGHPIFELGSMFNAYNGFAAIDPAKSVAFLGIERDVAEAVWRKSLSLYLGTDNDAVIRSVERKAAVVGIMRLLRRAARRSDSPDSADAVAFYRRWLEELLPTVDTLVLE